MVNQNTVKKSHIYYLKIYNNGENFKNAEIEDLGFKGLDILYDIVINWINNPYMLFRHYSIYYFIKEFEKYER